MWVNAYNWQRSVDLNYINFRQVVCCLLCLFVLVEPLSADYQLGVDAFHAKDYQEALNQWLKVAETSPDAQASIAELYYYGLGVEKDIGTSAEWYKKAANKGHALSAYNLGRICQLGLVGPANFSEAARWYLKAALDGHAGAQNNIGLMYESGMGVSRDPRKAKIWFEKAARSQVGIAYFNLGRLYYLGNGVKRDQNKAYTLYKIAAEKDVVVAKTALASIYKIDLKDSKAAAAWYLEAAKEGDPLAQMALGMLYKDGDGITQDYDQAFRWMKRAADNGQAEAHYELGYFYEEGIGTDSDIIKSIDHYRISAKSGNVRAYERIGKLYLKGHGVEKDETLAFESYLVAAKNGGKESKLFLCIAYQDGTGTNISWIESYAWCEVAKLAGFPDAEIRGQIALGKITPQEKKEANDKRKEYIDRYHFPFKSMPPIEHRPRSGVKELMA